MGKLCPPTSRKLKFRQWAATTSWWRPTPHPMESGLHAKYRSWLSKVVFQLVMATFGPFSEGALSAALPKAKGTKGVCSLLPESLRLTPAAWNQPSSGGALGTESSSWFADTLGGSDGKESACSVGDPWVRKIPWRREWQHTTVFLPGEFHGQRSLVGYSPRRSQRVGYDWMTNTFHFNFACLSCEILPSAWITNPG